MSVKKNYRPIKYHNWRHAVNVCQTMFAVLTTGKLGQFMSDEEVSTQVLNAPTFISSYSYIVRTGLSLSNIQYDQEYQ
jgi:hypothetical protein